VARVVRGEVVGLFVAEDQGLAMRRRESVDVLAGRGIDGDRYAAGRGAFSRSSRATVRHLTLIGRETIEAANRDAVAAFEEGEVRRNVITTGVDLDHLVGERFCIGHVAVVGIEPCLPCRRPSLLTGKPGFLEAYEGRSGLRVGVVGGGTITLGAPVLLGWPRGF
jgi:hypothetical protein